ncbi:hypothetical protein WOLCODRAFT_76869 [Wolfiporia cocos MD-104 SS10]|uniref:Nuclear pore complex protein Nup85 n=1 Tax=Wolfiporia cocos (strain MD-104) TaxID=742152 RepID=A0A2H3K6K2_WOLCO|nr:hypothetical protein WOLCODRAFT_76869 [Wolfiporia cocos MD-104 SS10]
MSSTSDELLALVPPLFEQGRSDDFRRAGLGLAVQISPRDDCLAIHAAPYSSGSQQTSSANHNVYLARLHAPPSAERRVFVTDTSIIFAAVRKLISDTKSNTHILAEVEAAEAMSKLAHDYINFCHECCLYCSQNITRPEEIQLGVAHYSMLYDNFSLVALLYVPEPARENVPICDDLMHWLNMHHVTPSSKETERLSALECPWEDARFWPTVLRLVMRDFSHIAAVFVRMLARHPSPFVQDLSARLVPIVSSHPRLREFNSEREFVIKLRRWRDNVKTLRFELDRVPEEEREDSTADWWEWFSDIVGVLEGREEVVRRVCEELRTGWKELLAVLCMFVETRMQRTDLPDVVAQLLEEMPPDPNDVENKFQQCLFLGKPQEALEEAAKLDVWLAAHLADIMDFKQLLDPDADESGMSVRDHYVLDYAEYLHSDPTLWRITVDYMCTCGDVGAEMADQVLLRVPLKLSKPANADQASAAIRAGNLAGVLAEINASCHEHKREEVRRTICRVAAQTFTKEKEYGLAVSYYASAENWAGVGRVIDCILDEYILGGPATFAHLVAGIAPSLQTLHPTSGEGSIFIHRLRFAVRFAEFHHHKLQGHYTRAAYDLITIFQEQFAPKSWWAVLLSDAVDLLRTSNVMLFSASDIHLLICRLEDIHIATEQGATDDYLSILAKTVRSTGDMRAQQRLQNVRLILIQYHAKCAIMGVGGKTSVNGTLIY